MLRKVINSFLVFLMVMGLAQEVNAQELKKYSGPFSIQLDRKQKIEGNAEYTYKDASDGTRIFQGDFKFSATPESIRNFLDRANWFYEEYPKNINSEEISLTAEGTFDNNYQVGEWVWKGPWPIGIRKLYKNQILKYTFSNDGRMEGPAYFYGDADDTYSITIKDDEPIGRINITTNAPNSTLKATWQDGKLVGDYLLIKKNAGISDWQTPYYRFGNVTKGQFNYEGYPVGKWTSEEYNKPTIYAIYSDSGDLIECYKIDDTTGDKIPAELDIEPVRFNTALFNARKNFMMRSTLNDYKSNSYYDDY